MGENFTQYDPFLIDVMEEFRLIETGSKKPCKKSLKYQISCYNCKEIQFESYKDTYKMC